jgi:hypothetical protein
MLFQECVLMCSVVGAVQRAVVSSGGYEMNDGHCQWIVCFFGVFNFDFWNFTRRKMFKKKSKLVHAL